MLLKVRGRKVKPGCFLVREGLGEWVVCSCVEFTRGEREAGIQSGWTSEPWHRVIRGRGG